MMVEETEPTSSQITRRRKEDAQRCNAVSEGDGREAERTTLGCMIASRVYNLRLYERHIIHCRVGG